MIQASTVINQYLRDEFWPNLWKAIKRKEIERRVERHMPSSISSHMVIGLLDSTIKNSSIIRRENKSIEPSPSNSRIDCSETISTQPKLEKHIQAKQQTIDCNHSGPQYQQNSSIKIDRSGLMRLPTIDQQEREEVKQMRIMKQRMRRFQREVEERRSSLAHLNHQSGRKKKSMHSQCKYHTYDFQTNIIPLRQPQHPTQPQINQSLLQRLKQSLDKQIEDQRICKRMRQIDSHRQQISSIIPASNIQKVKNSFQIGGKQAKSDPPLQPFEPSYIQALSQQFQNIAQEGVKMVTNQQRLVVQTEDPEKPVFRLKREKETFGRPSSPSKQKTLSSQSIIYAFNQKVKPTSTTDVTDDLTHHYQSLELQREQGQQKPLSYFQDQIQINTPPSYDIKLPIIRANRSFQQKRTATEKVIRGLDHIEVQSPSNQSHRQSRLLSAFSADRQSEKSIQETISIKNKKSLIKEYFKNYGNQFRIKRECASNICS